MSSARWFKLGKKAQSMPEMFWGYSRSILILFVILAALTKIGLFSNVLLAPESCVAFEGMGCVDQRADSSSVYISLVNAMGETIILNNITAEQCTGKASGKILDGETKQFMIDGCSLTSGEKYDGSLFFAYTGYSGLAHIEKGEIIAVVE